MSNLSQSNGFLTLSLRLPKKPVIPGLTGLLLLYAEGIQRSANLWIVPHKAGINPIKSGNDNFYFFPCETQDTATFSRKEQGVN